jgi:hypothetical protein
VYAWNPNASATAAKSTSGNTDFPTGSLRIARKCSSAPYAQSFISTMINGMSSRITVSSSLIVMRKPPSPITSTVGTCGRPLATPSAVPKPRPMEANSLVIFRCPGVGTVM